MQYHLLNSAVITSPGTYHACQLTQEEFSQEVVGASMLKKLRSYIGYEETATHIQSLTGVPIPVNRDMVIPLPGDTLLVCRPAYRVEPAQKGQARPIYPEDWIYMMIRYE